MEALILLATPIVASWATEQVKKIKYVKLSDSKAGMLRLFALTLSFGGIVAGALATGQDIPVDEISTYVEAILLFAATQIPYFYGKATAK